MLPEIFVLVTHVLSCFSELDKRVITSLNYTHYRVKLTVVNGKPARPVDVPHLVSLKEPILQKGKLKVWANLCGASVISHDGTLLTAAHCFEGNRFLYAKRPYILRAVTGSSKTDIISAGVSGISKDGVQWRKISKAILHQNFIFPENDIAIAFVEQPWDYKRGVAPIALATTDALGPYYTAGFGRIGHDPKDVTSEILMLARVEVLSKATCSMLWQMKMDNFICTNSFTSDVSEGDSGGPLWCEQRSGRQLVGVVSGKNFDKTTIYTRVSSYTNWIHSNGTKFFMLSKGTKLLYRYSIIIVLIVLFLVDFWISLQ